MNRRQLAYLVWGLTLLGTLPAWAESAAPSGAKRPLPHPDILSLPAGDKASPQTPSPAPTESTESAAVNVSATPTPAAPAALSAATEAPEGKEISRRETGVTITSANNENRAVGRGDAGNRSGLLRDIWPLLAVLGLIGGIAFFLKKYMPARRMFAGSQVLQIVARTHVSAKQQLMLIKLGRKMVLIGVSPEHIEAVATVDDPDQVAMLMGEIASTSPRSMSRAFVESMEDESEAYIELPVNDPTSTTQGQLHGLLHKVRTLSGKTE